MTENKRFIIYMGEPYYNNVFFKYDESADDYQFLCRTSDFGSILEELNALADEIERLKQEYQKLKHRHSLLHDECLDAECEGDSLKKDVNSLEEENEQLKTKNRGLQSELEIYKADVYHTTKINDKLFDENNELKEILKHTYETHECETCKYNQNFNWLDPATMKREYDSKCSKGLHYGEEVHGCKGYELDLEMFKKRIWG